MDIDRDFLSEIDTLADRLSCKHCTMSNTTNNHNLPGGKAITSLLKDLFGVLFPGCHAHLPIEEATCTQTIQEKLLSIATRLTDMVQRVIEFYEHQGQTPNCAEAHHRATTIARAFLAKLPELRTILQEDIQAAYEGDPAAKSTVEVVIAYPGLYAIATHRLAHELYLAGVDLIPRVMSEYAHTRTGIDIHPGATIGPGFFIDHGTGVVIGETCTIGKHVKVYQGVTLGALSFAKDENGALVKGVKRHPNVEDRVVIYAGATILGGDTTIGHDSVIGGNVWIIASVPCCTMIYNQPPTPQIKRLKCQAAEEMAKRESATC